MLVFILHGFCKMLLCILRGANYQYEITSITLVDILKIHSRNLTLFLLMKLQKYVNKDLLFLVFSFLRFLISKKKKIGINFFDFLFLYKEIL